MLTSTHQRGFTLIEFLVAFTISAIAALLISQAISSAVNIEKRVTEVATATNQISRVWEVMADDFQHVVARPWVDQFETTHPAMVGLLGDRQSQSAATAVSDDSYVLRFVRGGEKAFFPVSRSNLHIVAYRLVADEEDIDDNDEPTVNLWRDRWRPVDNVREPVVKSRLLLESIKTINFRYLPSGSDDTGESAWLTGWPDDSQQPGQLPLAVEVAIDIDGFGEVVRLLPLVSSL